jgi:Transcriptional regulatory protein, C terminal
MAACAISSRTTHSTPTGASCIAARTSSPSRHIDYLIRNRERVVSKDDLINAIWDGRIVSDAALTTRLNIARNSIGDSGEEQPGANLACVMCSKEVSESPAIAFASPGSSLTPQQEPTSGQTDTTVHSKTFSICKIA